MTTAVKLGAGRLAPAAVWPT